MGALTKILVACLMASFHGVSNCAIIPVANKHGLVRGSAPKVEAVPLTTVGTITESNVVSESSHILSNVTTQGVGLVTAVPSGSSSVRPTRTGEDTSGRPRPSFTTSHVHSPIMTEIPKDNVAVLDFEWLKGRDSDRLALQYQEVTDDNKDTELSPRDNFDGYGYGSSTASPANGGYGSSPGTTNLPPGGYGDPPSSPAIVDPSVVTVQDPETVTVSLTTQSLPSPALILPTVATVVVITEATPSTTVPHAAVPEDVTVTVPAAQPTSSIYLSIHTQEYTTVVVPAESTHTTQSYVYTTVTPSSSAPHGSSRTIVIVQPSPTTIPAPVPLSTNAAPHAAKPNQCLLIVAAAFGSIGTLMSIAVGGPMLLLASNNKHSNGGQAKDSKIDNSPEGRGGSQCATQ
ncbi:hypothetical protein F4804DRAFT_325551 [Jackrogersella minutella]|nr:hypothetical protein F4804DRAFT_325551 [Jackrogersella minutella]